MDHDQHLFRGLDLLHAVNQFPVIIFRVQCVPLMGIDPNLLVGFFRDYGNGRAPSPITHLVTEPNRLIACSPRNIDQGYRILQLQGIILVLCRQRIGQGWHSLNLAGIGMLEQQQVRIFFIESSHGVVFNEYP